MERNPDRVIVVRRAGGPEVLELDRVQLDSPGPGQACVRHRAIGLNFIDTYHRSGLYPLAMPTGLGSEAAGVVEAIGPGVTEVAVGDRVAYAGGPPGAYADARVIAADRLVRVPDAIDFDTAAAMMLKGMTVEYLVRRTFAVRPGMTVVWHAAAGGVGLIACQWLAHLGVTVIGTVGSDAKAELARANGCTHTIVYTREDFAARVREITDGKGVPVVYDAVGKQTFAGSLDCLAPRGLLVEFGNASGKPDPFDLLLLAAKGSLYVTRPTLFTYTAARADLLESANALFDVVTRGVVRIPVRQRFALENVAEAHRAMESRATIGSSVLVP
jgi:NADPH2:quinone reductase